MRSFSTMWRRRLIVAFSMFAITFVAGTALAQSTKFSIGDSVVTTQKVAVRATPNGTKLGSQAANSLGKVVGGPTVAGSYTWWQIDYGFGVDGWSAEPFLEKYTPPFSIGSRVQTNTDGVG